MAVTPLTYDEIEDLRYNPFTNEYTPNTIGTAGVPTENRTIPNSAPYIIKLYEAPQQNAPSTTRITIGATELIEVSKSVVPDAGQYRVVYYDELGMGQVEFNSAQAGQEAHISYYGLGHLIQKISLDTRVPSTGNTTIAGNKTFPGNCIVSGDWNFTGSPTFENTVTVQASMNININAADRLVRIGYRSDTPSDIPDTPLEIYIDELYYGDGGLYVCTVNNDTASARKLITLKNLTTGNMAANFGLMISFEVEDSNNTTYNVGKIVCSRASSDTTSQMEFRVNNAGNTGMIIDTNRIVDCHYGGIRTRYESSNISTPPSDAELDALFDVPATLGNGWLGLVKDTSAANMYLVVVADGSWYYSDGASSYGFTKAV